MRVWFTLSTLFSYKFNNSHLWNALFEKLRGNKREMSSSTASDPVVHTSRKVETKTICLYEWSGLLSHAWFTKFQSRLFWETTNVRIVFITSVVFVNPNKPMHTMFYFWTVGVTYLLQSLILSSYLRNQFSTLYTDAEKGWPVFLSYFLPPSL